MPRRRRRARRLAALVVATVLASSIAAAPAWATFTGRRSAATAISSASLQPVSDLSVTRRCDGVLSTTATATVSWTATPSSFAAGYHVERWRGTTLEVTRWVTPRTATSAIDGDLALGTTYTWRVRSSAWSWTSTPASVSATTPALCS